MQKILVTGYTGFIGCHLVDSLKKKYDIIGLARNKKKIPDISQIKCDIRKLTTEKLPKKIDSIIHLAAMTDLLSCQNNPVECFDINVNGTQNLLEIARKMKSKFFYVSTHHVYGYPKKLPVSENDPLNPESIYATSKAMSELLCKSYSSSFGVDASLLRLFSVYGPKSPEHLVTTRLILQLHRGNKFEVGNLSPKRDFIFIKDVCSAIEIILLKSRGSNVYNIGTGKSYSIFDICKILQNISMKKMTTKSIKSLSRKSDVQNIFADNSKIKQLGWKSQTNFTNGLKLTYDWYSKK